MVLILSNLTSPPAPAPFFQPVVRIFSPSFLTMDLETIDLVAAVSRLRRGVIQHYVWCVRVRRTLVQQLCYPFKDSRNRKQHGRQAAIGSLTTTSSAHQIIPLAPVPPVGVLS